MSQTLRVTVASVFLLLGTLLFIRPAHAAIINVNTIADDLTTNGNCTLREAVQAANTDSAVDVCTAGSGSDTINLGAGTYTVSIPGVEDLNVAGDFDILSAITILGKSSTTTILDGGSFDRVFDVSPTGSLSLGGATVQHGSSGTDGAGGGAIYTDGTLSLADDLISDNATSQDGGGVAISSTGSAIIGTTTIRLNTASIGGGGISNQGDLNLMLASVWSNDGTTGGGGIWNDGSSFVLRNVTINGNSASFGGGIYNNSVHLGALVNVTIAGNTGSTGSGGFSNDGGTMSIYDTIIAGNAYALAPDCDGTSAILSGDYNLLQSTTGCTFTPGIHDIIGQDPLLGNLSQNNYSLAWSMPPLTGSPAIDAGNNATCQVIDQRSVSRPQVGVVGHSAVCDIGAYELDITAPSIAEVTPVPALTRLVQPQYSFSSTEGGTYTLCGSQGGPAAPGNETIYLLQFPEGAYVNCVMTITDRAGNVSNVLAVTPFTIDRTSPKVTVVTTFPMYSKSNTINVLVTASETTYLTYSGCTGDKNVVGPGSVTLSLTMPRDNIKYYCGLDGHDLAGNIFTSLSVGPITTDTTAPIITLNGPSVVTLNVGQGYADQGAWALDAIDGYLTSHMVITKKVNTATVGTYTYTYKVADQAGNATIVTRTILVVPQILSLNVSRGAYTGNFNGKKRTIRPLGSYTGKVFAKKMVVDKSTQPFYVFIPLDPQKSPNIVVVNYKGDVVRRTSLASLSTKGLNIDAAYNGTSANIAIGALTKGTTVQLYRLTSSATQLVGTLKQATVGTVFVRFMNLISTPGQGYALVTAVKGKPYSIKVWRYNPTTKKYPQLTTYNIKNIILTNAGLTLKNKTALIP